MIGFLVRHPSISCLVACNIRRAVWIPSKTPHGARKHAWGLHTIADRCVLIKNSEAQHIKFRPPEPVPDSFQHAVLLEHGSWLTGPCGNMAALFVNAAALECCLRRADMSGPMQQINKLAPHACKLRNYRTRP